MKTKRIISILVIALLCMLFAACGSKDKKEETKVTPTTAAGTDIEEPNQKQIDNDKTDKTDENNNTEENDGTEEPAKEAHIGFKVDGTKLLDAKGNEFVMRGVNHAHAWFASQDGVALKAIAETGSNTVRIVCADGEQWTADTLKTLQTLVQVCKDNKLVCIFEIHDATGSNEKMDLLKAAIFWTEMKDVFIGNEDYVILNIANEWMGEWSEDKWASAYKEAIGIIREEGIMNTIMVDAPGWGQYGAGIVNKGQEVLAADPLGNTMFSVHMYGTAGGSQEKIKSVLQGAIDKNLCICVGEFGYNHSDGDVDEAYIMQFCQENSLGYLGWSWKGNGGGVEYLDIAKEWDGSVLSDDWGVNLIDGENGIRKTSKICSIYD